MLKFGRSWHECANDQHISSVDSERINRVHRVQPLNRFAVRLMPGGAGHGSFCAVVDGVSWTASDLAPRFVPCAGTNPLTCSFLDANPEALACRAFDSQGTAMTFLITATLGTQHFGSEGNFCCQEAVLTDGNGALYGAERPGGSATFRITSLTSGLVAGTFSFVAPARSSSAVGQKTVTAGRFSVTNFSSCFGN